MSCAAPNGELLSDRTRQWAAEHNARLENVGRPDEWTNRPTKRIAIVGKAPSSVMYAPYGDLGWEIWALSDLYRTIPRWDRYFEIHDPAPRKERWGDYWEWLQKEHKDKDGKLKPIYMQKAYPECPCAVPYPKNEIVERFGNYFTNSVSWMIALAIMEGATDIGLWGVDMAQQAVGVKSEYARQRPSCEYFLGIAMGLGIQTYVHEKSDLLKCKDMYAFDSDPNAMRIKIMARRDELMKRLRESEKKRDTAAQDCLVVAGALDDLSWCEEWIA